MVEINREPIQRTWDRVVGDRLPRTVVPASFGAGEEARFVVPLNAMTPSIRGAHVSTKREEQAAASISVLEQVLRYTKERGVPDFHVLVRTR